MQSRHQRHLDRDASNYNIYYNTVRLAASSTGANFGTTGLFHAASATTSTATLDLRNNAIINESTPNGTGLTVAYRRSAGAAGSLSNYIQVEQQHLLRRHARSEQPDLLGRHRHRPDPRQYTGGVFTAGTIAPRER